MYKCCKSSDISIAWQTCDREYSQCTIWFTRNKASQVSKAIGWYLLPLKQSITGIIIKVLEETTSWNIPASSSQISSNRILPRKGGDIYQNSSPVCRQTCHSSSIYKIDLSNIASTWTVTMTVHSEPYNGKMWMSPSHRKIIKHPQTFITIHKHSQMFVNIHANKSHYWRMVIQNQSP